MWRPKLGPKQSDLHISSKIMKVDASYPLTQQALSLEVVVRKKNSAGED
jgi:hypothetical protein